MADGEDDKLHSPPIFSEGHDEAGVIFGLLRDRVFVAEVYARADLDENDGALLLIERGRVGGGGFR